MQNSRTNRRPALWAALGLAIVVNGSAAADPSLSKRCDVHAVAMVAEMKAAADHPMNDQEMALVRETAMKSCLAQSGADTNPSMTTPAAVVAPPSAPATVAAVAPATADTSFMGTLGALFSAPTTRKPGNQRLLDRSQH